MALSTQSLFLSLESSEQLECTSSLSQVLSVFAVMVFSLILVHGVNFHLLIMVFIAPSFVCYVLHVFLYYFITWSISFLNLSNSPYLWKTYHSVSYPLRHHHFTRRRTGTLSSSPSASGRNTQHDLLRTVPAGHWGHHQCHHAFPPRHSSSAPSPLPAWHPPIPCRSPFPYAFPPSPIRTPPPLLAVSLPPFASAYSSFPLSLFALTVSFRTLSFLYYLVILLFRSFCFSFLTWSSSCMFACFYYFSFLLLSYLSACFLSFFPLPSRYFDGYHSFSSSISFYSKG